MSDSPRIWSKFSATNRSGAVCNFRIVDLPKDRYGDFLEQYINCYVKEESTFKAAGVAKSAEALKEIKQTVLKRRDDEATHTVICCLDNENDEIKDIIGASIMMFGTPEEVIQTKLNFKTEEMKKLFEIIHGLDALYDERKAFDLGRYFSDRGVFVCPEYRGLGIAQELLKVRRLICKEHGIQINGAWMTSYGTQKAAERDGWQTVYEIKCEELGKIFGVTYGRSPPYKFMIARIQV